jgi:serine/threonine protein kinase/cytochrome c-type biogenesis protein CcmH/NrfG
MALPIGTVLNGKFKIVQVLGEGGMGTVYKVEQLGTNPPYYYAVKELLINPNTSEEDRKAAIERFNKEISLLSGLIHPRIAVLTEWFDYRGNRYFAMEFVPGRSLEKMLEDAHGPLPEEQVIKWMMQVCEALTYIHTRTPPVILRDLKPGNIMITPNNEVKLIDFGIARRFDPSKRTNTENLGTISYASPEHLGSITAPGQARSQGHGRLVQTDARSDIYSLGATMYHLLTNYEPDPIQTPAPGSILAKNPRLHTIQAGNSRICPIEQVIIKAMQQDPARRFQSAEAMRVALQQCLPGAGIQQAANTLQIPAMSPNATIYVPPVMNNGNSSSGTGGLICPRCGFQNRPGAKFCKRDGQPLVRGVAIAPPRSPIKARPVQQPLPPRGGTIQARPVQQSSSPRGSTIQARPVQQSATVSRNNNAIQARSVAGSYHNGVAETTPKDPGTAYRQGLQQLVNKNYQEAVRQFQLALQLGAPSYDALYNLGRAYRQLGQSERETNQHLFIENLKLAAEKFEEAAKQKPDALDTYFQLGLCYRDLNLLPQAKGAFLKAKGAAPRDPAVYYQLGLLNIEQGNYREAEKCLRDGLAIQPDHALILIALGRLFMKTNKAKRAISTLRQAMQIDPMLWEGWYELGRAHMLAKEWQLALSALEQARQEGPPFVPEVNTAMATCYLKLNKKADARQLVKETLNRDPGNSEAKRLQKQL